MGWVNFFLAENESHIYPNMCAKFGCGPTVVSKKGGYRQTDRQTDRQTGKGKLQLYIVDVVRIQCSFHLHENLFIVEQCNYILIASASSSSVAVVGLGFGIMLFMCRSVRLVFRRQIGMRVNAV